MKTTAISVASWAPNRLDVFGVGADNALYHKAWNGTTWETSWEDLGGSFISTSPSPSAPILGAPVITGGAATYDSGNLTSSLPLQGSAHVVFDAKGDYTFTCHAHDSGFDNIDYVVAAVILNSDGIAFTFQHMGGVEGTSAGLPFGTPRRDDAYTVSGTNAEIVNVWSSIPGSSMASSINGQDALVGGIETELGKLLNSLLKELAQAAATAIIALV